jgi:hypothetical protein
MAAAACGYRRRRSTRTLEWPLCSSFSRPSSARQLPVPLFVICVGKWACLWLRLGGPGLRGLWARSARGWWRAGRGARLHERCLESWRDRAGPRAAVKKWANRGTTQVIF